MTKNQSFERGQAIFEFMLVIPLLLILFVFIFDLGRVTFYMSVLNNAAREAARYGIVHPSDESGIISVANEMAHGIAADDMIVSVTQAEDGAVIVVSIEYTFIPATPLVASMLGVDSAIALDTQAAMQIED